MKNLVITDGIVTDICDPNVEEIVIPEGVTRIEEYALSGAKFKKVVFPESLKTIATGAFEDCVNLEEICLNDWLDEIEPYAFQGCKNLTRIDLSRYIYYIGAGAFAKCNKVKEVECNGNSIFEFKYGCLIEDGHIIAASFGNPIPTDVLIDTIKESAYSGDGHFVIKIPENIKTIEEYAFSDCDYLTHVEIAHEMESVEENAFFAEHINTIVLSSNCGNIHKGAFWILNSNRCDIFLDDDYIPYEVYDCIHYAMLSYYHEQNIPVNDRSGTHNIWVKSQWKKINGTPVPLSKRIYAGELFNVYLCGIGYNIFNRSIEFGIKIEDPQDKYGLGVNKTNLSRIEITDFGFDYISYMHKIDKYLYEDIFISDIYSWDPNNFYLDIDELNERVPSFKKMFVEFDVIGLDGKITDSFEVEFDLPN